MGKKTRQVLAVTMVAAALCAVDRAIVESAPAPRVHGGGGVGLVARQLASRITSSFRVTIPAVRLDQVRQQHVDPIAPPFVAIERRAFVHASETTPFQFRLPPPIL